MRILIGQKVIHDEDEAIENLEKVYTGIIRSIVKPILKDERLVEECLNDIWYKLSRHLEKVYSLDEMKQKTYICTTAKNAALDIYRKQKGEISVGIGDDIREYAVKEGRHFKDVLEKYELAEDVREALSYLGKEDRKIILLHHYLKFTYKEIAEELGMSEAAVTKRGQRAGIEIRKKMGKR